ncbi:hypothetical protein D3C81_1180730 [compost metagenome]
MLSGTALLDNIHKLEQHLQKSAFTFRIIAAGRQPYLGLMQDIFIVLIRHKIFNDSGYARYHTHYSFLPLIGIRQSVFYNTYKPFIGKFNNLLTLYFADGFLK